MLNTNHLITDLKLVEGKTISKILIGIEEELLIVFNDKTFIGVRVRSYGDSFSLEEMESFDPTLFGVNVLVSSGLYTQEEMSQLLDERKAKWEERQKERELNEYERLKKKFG